PDRVLFTAIVAGFLISALGGSRVQIGGPTGAFVVIVYGIVQNYGYDGLVICTILAGLLLILFGVAKLGGFIKFIPFPVTTGFTSGIAVIIFSGQIKDLLGLSISKLPGHFTEQWAAYWEHLGSANVTAILLSAVSLAIILLWPRVTRKIPGSIVAMILVTALVQIFHLPVETIGSRFGEIPASLPSPSFPTLSFEKVRSLLSPALTVALLGAIESLLSAVVADGMTGMRHKSNTELIAQGIANIVSPIFGGIPATGAIARTATNVRNGGRTPVAGMVHALVLLLILMLFGKWARLIPLCVLASVLVVVAYNMSEWHAFKSLLKAPKSDMAVLLTTFLLTVFFDLTLAVQVGMVLAAFLFMKRMADVTNIGMITREIADPKNAGIDLEDALSIHTREVPQGVEVFEIKGPFFFGVAETLKDTLDVVETPPKVLILRMRDVPAMDATGLFALIDLKKRCERQGTTLVLSGVHAQPYLTIDKAGKLDFFGQENVLTNIDSALNRAREILGLPPVTPPLNFVPTVASEAESKS
ncbi:MAG TPA: SulP family inorganic anion transporter, partial [bacterium]|nr:SulP family inorganic anion transporter [bacterium]